MLLQQSPANMYSPIKILSKPGQDKQATIETEERPTTGNKNELDNQIYEELGILKLTSDIEPNVFNLIDDREWNIIKSGPTRESAFLTDGHAAMSIISVIGPMGVGKSTLMNVIAGKDVFKTHKSASTTKTTCSSSRHVTQGIDVYATHHRILLDCQPLLATSVLENFYTGHSHCLTNENSRAMDPIVSADMISLQLATFLIATSDYVIIMSNWLINIHLLKLLSTSIMLIGEDNIRAKFILYSENDRIFDSRLKTLVDSCLGKNRVEKYFNNPHDLIRHTNPYSSEKCDLFMKDPTVFTGKNWLASCDRLWTTNIMNSAMFSCLAHFLSHPLS